MVWTPAFNAAIQLEQFGLALRLAELGAPTDFTDVAWERIEGQFKRRLAQDDLEARAAKEAGSAPPTRSAAIDRMDGIMLQMAARLPAAYAMRPDWLMESNQPHHQRHNMLNRGAGLGSDARGGPQKAAPALLAFDAALRSGRLGKLPVPAWAGRALSRWAFAADRDIWSQNQELLDLRGRRLEELWAASIAAGGDPFEEWVEGGRNINIGGARELLLRCSKSGVGFALARFPAMERLGAFEALLKLKPEARASLVERLRERRGSELADGVVSFVEAAQLRQDLPAKQIEAGEGAAMAGLGRRL